MTNRERYIDCALGKPIDRSPFAFYFGPWRETLIAWEEQGVKNPGTAWLEGFGFDPQVIKVAETVNQLHYPEFEPHIIERKSNTVIEMDWLGQVIERVEGKDGISKILKSPVTCREEWETLKKERLDPHDPRRFPRDWKQQVAAWKTIDAPVQIGLFPCGLYGTLRDLMGVEGSLYAFYDDPELVHDIMDYLTDFWIVIYEKICADIQVDILHIWEDMSGKQGSLLSPDIIREFMLPNYRKLKKFADEHGIPVLQVDTDGNCEMLIRVFHEAGINMMMPFEVTAESDIRDLRQRYPYMAMQGGIDKQEITKGSAAIDAELERIRPLINKPGYFPALDHLIPPELSFQDYTYFVHRLREMIFASASKS